MNLRPQTWEQSVRECGLLVGRYPFFLGVMPLGWQQGLRVCCPRPAASGGGQPRALCLLPLLLLPGGIAAALAHACMLHLLPTRSLVPTVGMLLPPLCPAEQDSYQPAQVGEGLWIVPVWSQPPDPAATNIRLEPGGRRRPSCGATAPRPAVRGGWAGIGTSGGGTAVRLRVSPPPAAWPPSPAPSPCDLCAPLPPPAGLAFGTGDHPTTRLCLRWLRGLQQRGALQGAAVMDYGAGSGVLAVAALLMGAARAVRWAERGMGLAGPLRGGRCTLGARALSSTRACALGLLRGGRCTRQGQAGALSEHGHAHRVAAANVLTASRRTPRP